MRFPLYVAAAQVWLARDRDIRIIMFISITLGMLIMCLILISETIIEPKPRLTWPYGDLVPGGYIAKFSLPIFCALIAIAVSKKSSAGFFSGIVGLLTIAVSTLTGERTNFLIRACGGLLASLVWKPKFIMFSFLILIEFLAILFIFMNRPDLSDRFVGNFISNVPS